MRSIVFVGLLLALAGCNKKSDVYMFDCVVFDDKINQAVEGASVVMKVQNAAGGFNPSYVTVGSAVTDANGRFYIEVEKEVYYSFRVEVTHPVHFDGTFDVNPDDVPFSTAYSSTFSLEPRAWVSTHLINQNGSQTASFKVDAETDECTQCCPSSLNYIQGTDVDSTLICMIYGNQEFEVKGSYADQNGATHQILETGYATAFDTAVVTIIY